MASKAPNFDPTKPSGAIKGQHEKYPDARFEQNGFLYTIHHQLCNKDRVVEEEVSDADAANAELTVKLQKKLADLTEKIRNIAPKISDGSATASEKTKHTKALKAYEQVKDELESLSNE